jgi:hypothetical protein
MFSNSKRGCREQRRFPRYFDDVEYCVGEEYKERCVEGDGYGDIPVAVICNDPIYPQNVRVSDDTHSVSEIPHNNSILDVDGYSLNTIIKLNNNCNMFYNVGSALGISIILSTS